LKSQINQLDEKEKPIMSNVNFKPDGYHTVTLTWSCAMPMA
jgi:hypothetical protein